ncbi:tail fiber protein [Escherichia coli]|nr:tail fiber protein [Escherichia coli]
MPVPWPSAIPPTGWLKCNGADFSAVEYPKLARVYPTNRLPDLRGEFIRGWDDGRGVDSGRALLSTQTDEFKSHSHYFERTWAQTGFDTTGGYYLLSADVSGSVNQQRSDSTNSVGGSESRPRNIAFNYIVRAV